LQLAATFKRGKFQKNIRGKNAERGRRGKPGARAEQNNINETSEESSERGGQKNHSTTQGALTTETDD